MAIAQMTDGAPRVDEQSDGMIGLYAVDNDAADDRYHGFLFDRTTALAVALRLLGTVQHVAGERAPMLPVQSVEAAVVKDPDHAPYVRVAFQIEGAIVPVFLDRGQLTDMIAELAGTLRMMT